MATNGSHVLVFGRDLHGVVHIVSLQDHSEFRPQLYVRFWTNTVRKGMNCLPAFPTKGFSDIFLYTHCNKILGNHFSYITWILATSKIISINCSCIIRILTLIRTFNFWFFLLKNLLMLTSPLLGIEKFNLIRFHFLHEWNQIEQTNH